MESMCLSAFEPPLRSWATSARTSAPSARPQLERPQSSWPPKSEPRSDHVAPAVRVEARVHQTQAPPVRAGAADELRAVRPAGRPLRRLRRHAEEVPGHRGVRGAVRRHGSDAGVPGCGGGPTLAPHSRADEGIGRLCVCVRGTALRPPSQQTTAICLHGAHPRAPMRSPPGTPQMTHQRLTSAHRGRTPRKRDATTPRTCEATTGSATPAGPPP